MIGGEGGSANALETLSTLEWNCDYLKRERVEDSSCFNLEFAKHEGTRISTLHGIAID
jgi:hypothetical protein